MRVRLRAIIKALLIVVFIITVVVFVFLGEKRKLPSVDAHQAQELLLRVRGVDFRITQAEQPPQHLEARSIPKQSKPSVVSPSFSNKTHAITKNDNLDNDVFKLGFAVNSAPKTKVKLIILTYMRSGSSLTGDVFDHHPNTFYIYEPLWSIQTNFLNKEYIIFLNRTYLKPDIAKFNLSNSVASETLENFLNCNHYNIDVKTLSQYHMSHSQTSKAFHSCHNKHPGVFGAVRCLPSLMAPCKEAEVTTVKTIRYNMAQAEQFIKKDLKVKVVHLVRDPRGALLSQTRVGEFNKTDVDKAAKQFCARVLDDLLLAEKIKSKTPGRVLTVRYEDLAMEPLFFAEKLLAFAGLNITQTLKDYLWNITSAGKPDDCVICTTRNDSKATASMWRKRLSMDDTKVIQTNCRDLFDRLGYVPLKSVPELLNLTVPTLLRASKVAGLWT